MVTTDDPAGTVATLAPNEVFELVHEVGFEDAQELIALATPQQIQGCFDLDGWNRDHLDLAPLKPWLAALIEAGYEKVGEVWGALDAELRAMILQRMVKVYDVSLEEDPEEDPTRDQSVPVMATPDRFFMLELHGDEDHQRLTQRIVEDLYRADADLARHTIMSARSEPAAELEETAYRWRSGRLADLGYVDFYDALDLFRPLEPSAVAIGENTQDLRVHDDAGRLTMVMVEEVIGRSFLARAMDVAGELESERVEAAIVTLVNKVLAAARAKPGQTEVVQRGALFATATLSLGLETVSRGDLGRASEALRTIALQRLFRVGYTVTVKLSRLAQALAPRAVLASSPARELVAGLCSPRPLFSRAADDPPITGLRPFESQADLRRAGEVLAGLTVTIALVESLGIDLIAASQAPEPRPRLDDWVRTALARAAVGGEFRGQALSQAELTTLRQQGFRIGKLVPAARRAGHDAIVARLGAQQLATSAIVVARLVDGWLDDLETMLAAVTDAEIDPRFVEGVLVEVRRS